MTVTRMLLHNLTARTLRAGLRVGEATATTLRRAGYLSLGAVIVVHTLPLQLALLGGGGASLAGGLWLRRKVERWRGDGALFVEPGARRASKPSSEPRGTTARRGAGPGVEVEEIPPGSIVEVLHARPGERGAWQVLGQAPTRGRGHGRGGVAYLVAHPRTGKPRVIDAARLVVVAPPPPAARPLAAALARGRGNARGRGRAALPDTDPLGRADTLQARSAALRAGATTTRRHAGAVTAAATRGRQRAERGRGAAEAAEAAERARQPGQHRTGPTTKTRT